MGYFGKNARFSTRRRGVALLMVMIALVVGMILTAGFLASQGTALGIARNQKSFDQARSLAESAVDACIWRIKNKSDWRRTTTPGLWMNNVAIGSGTASATVMNVSGSGGFLDDTSQGVVITGTATVDGRTSTVSATVTPTGGGKPWSTGAFASGNLVVRDSAVVDGFNSSLGSYAISWGAYGRFGTNQTSSTSLQVLGLATFLGTYTSGVTDTPTGTEKVDLTAVGPQVVVAAAEPRVVGQVVAPNTAGFTLAAAYTGSGTFTLMDNRVGYQSFQLVPLGTTVCTIAQNAVLWVRGDMTIQAGCTLKISSGYQVNILVDGNTTIYGNVNVMGTGKLQIFCRGNVDLRGSAVVNNPNNPSGLAILGLNNCSSVTVREQAKVSAAVLAPVADVMIRDTTIYYGSAVGQTLTVRDSAKMHMDEALRNAVFHDVTGGSYMGDYKVAWQQ